MGTNTGSCSSTDRKPGHARETAARLPHPSTLMKKGPWDKPEEDDPSSLVAYEEFRQYRALNRRYHQQVRQQLRLERLMRWLVRPALIGLGSGAVVWAYLSYDPSLSFSSSPSVAQVRSSGPFRNCAAARAAGAAPLRRSQPGYASHLDADGDGIACEWSWRNWLQQ
jgi:Excalibur calcium-binding domain